MAAALAAFEEDSGQRCVDHFGLVAGTSTGAPSPSGWTWDFRAREICDFYVKYVAQAARPGTIVDIDHLQGYAAERLLAAIAGSRQKPEPSPP